MGHRIVLYKSYPFVSSKDDTLDAWHGGKDFTIQGVGAMCSIRDFEAMKNDYDIIELKWVDSHDMQQHLNIFTHILTGVTTYA